MRNSESEKRAARWALFLALLWAIVPSIITLVMIAPIVKEIELRKILQTASVTLLFGACLGGMVKFLFDEVVAARQRQKDLAESIQRRREADVAFLTDVLSNLRSVADNVDRAKLLIPAHQSVKTYGDEMRAMIEARVQLSNITRTLNLKAGEARKQVCDKVNCEIEKMEQYLGALINEFRDKYKNLSDKQRGYEKFSEARLGLYASDKSTNENTTPPELPTFVWEEISALQHLKEFIMEHSAPYKENFKDPLDTASKELYSEIIRSIEDYDRVSKT